MPPWDGCEYRFCCHCRGTLDVNLRGEMFILQRNVFLQHVHGFDPNFLLNIKAESTMICLSPFIELE